MTAMTKLPVSPLMKLAPTRVTAACGLRALRRSTAGKLRVSGPQYNDCSNEVACLSFDGNRPIAHDRYVLLSSNAIGFVGHKCAALQPVPVPVSPLMEIAPSAHGDQYVRIPFGYSFCSPMFGPERQRLLLSVPFIRVPLLFSFFLSKKKPQTNKFLSPLPEPRAPSGLLSWFVCPT
jgi:hypothetical protein